MSLVYCKCGRMIDADEPENYREEFGDDLMCESCYEDRLNEWTALNLPGVTDTQSGRLF